jgi:nitrogen-specific signal transduction histidine kinase
LALALLDRSTTRSGSRSDRARAIVELREAQRTQDAFVRATVHDLNNGLAIIKGRAQLLQRALRRETRLEPVAVEAGLAVVVAAADELAAVVAGLNAEVERSAGEPSGID